MKKLLSSLVFISVIFGCAIDSGPAKLYDGPDRPLSETVTLYPPSLQVGTMVMEFNGRRPGNCFTGCMFIKPVIVSAGTIKFTGTMNAVPLSDDSISPEFPDASIKVHPASYMVRESSIFASAFSVDHEETFEAGKSYQMEFGFKRENVGIKRYLWWQIKN